MYIYDDLTVTILNFLLSVESGSTQNSSSGTPDLENMVLAVGISFLSHQQADIYSIIRRLAATIFNFSLPVASGSTHNSTSSMPDLKNMLLAV